MLLFPSALLVTLGRSLPPRGWSRTPRCVLLSGAGSCGWALGSLCTEPPTPRLWGACLHPQVLAAGCDSSSPAVHFFLLLASCQQRQQQQIWAGGRAAGDGLSLRWFPETPPARCPSDPPLYCSAPLSGGRRSGAGAPVPRKASRPAGSRLPGGAAQDSRLPAAVGAPVPQGPRPAARPPAALPFAGIRSGALCAPPHLGLCPEVWGSLGEGPPCKAKGSCSCSFSLLARARSFFFEGGSV